jgi:hypothetical protein
VLGCNPATPTFYYYYAWHNIFFLFTFLCVMKKIILLLITLITINNVSYASFPVNNINNQIYNQSEIVAKSSPDIGAILGVTLILSYLVSILWYLSKPIPKDVKKRKKFFRKLLLLIFIPIIIVGIVVIHSLQNMSINISLGDLVDAAE